MVKFHGKTMVLPWYIFIRDMDIIPFEVFLKNIHLIPQDQIVQWHYL